MSEQYDKRVMIMKDALLNFQVISSLKLPKKTRIIGTKEGHEIHRPDGISYLVNPIPHKVKD